MCSPDSKKKVKDEVFALDEIIDGTESNFSNDSSTKMFYKSGSFGSSDNQQIQFSDIKSQKNIYLKEKYTESSERKEKPINILIKQDGRRKQTNEISTCHTTQLDKTCTNTINRGFRNSCLFTLKTYEIDNVRLLFNISR